VPTTVGGIAPGTITMARPITQAAVTTAPMVQSFVSGTAARTATVLKTTGTTVGGTVTQAGRVVTTGTTVGGTVTQGARVVSGGLGAPVASGITGSVGARVVSGGLGAPFASSITGSVPQAMVTSGYVSSGVTTRSPQVISASPQVISASPIVRQVFSSSPQVISASPIVRQAATVYTGEVVRPSTLGGAAYTKSDLDEMNRRLKALEVERGEKTASAFVFIKPHAVTDGVKDMVANRFACEGITVLSEGAITSEQIDKDMLIDTHYGAIANRAMKQKPAELVVPQKAKDEFESAFGLSWSDALAKGLVYNLVDGAAKLGLTYGELGDRYDQLKKGTTLLKFGGGFYCGKVDDIFVINGFYARMRSQFTVPGESIYYYEVQWDASRLPWGVFRGKLLGGTDPKDADESSMRNEIFRTWASLGLTSEPNTGNNGLHASASPFEALSERSNWLGVPLSQDFFGRAMLASGIPLGTITEWCGDPAVMFDSKKQSLFDLLEDLDPRQCLKKSSAIISPQETPADVAVMNSGLGALEIERAEKVSAAFVFIKPHAVTAEVRDFVADRFASEGVTVLSEGLISSEQIDQDLLIDKHYGAIAARAMKQKPAELAVSDKAKDDFQNAFGLSWSDALKNGLVYNLVDGAAELGCTYGELGDLYDQLEKGTTLLKFGGGFYCGKVGDIFVINGFYARMRAQFTVPGESIYYFEVEWEASRLPWGDFRGKLLGGTDPKTADEFSMRNIIFREWQALGLASEPNTGNNGLHASASPFEALSERSNWLGVPLSEDFFGRAMIASGIPLATIEAWTEDPAVMFDGKKQSLFDLLEDLDGREVLKKSSAINSS